MSKKKPIDLQKRDTARLWPAVSGDPEGPAQAPYVSCRDRRVDANRSWVALNRRPASAATNRHLGAC